jgi:hypothetical protein
MQPLVGGCTIASPLLPHLHHSLTSRWTQRLNCTTELENTKLIMQKGARFHMFMIFNTYIKERDHIYNYLSKEG